MDPKKLPLNFDELSPSLLSNPDFAKFLEMIGSPSPTQQSTPSNFPNFVPPTQNCVQSSYIFQGSSTHFNERQYDEGGVIPERLKNRSRLFHYQYNRHQLTASAARSWSNIEDEALVACYMEHCSDAIIGTNQKASTLWRKIGESYNAAQASRPSELPVRNVRMLESRWRRIVPDINLRVSCYDEACKVTGSGYNDEDAITAAHRIFIQSTNPPRNFLLVPVWKMLCAYPKRRLKIRWRMSKKEREVVDLGGDEEEGRGSDNRSRLDDDANTVIGSSNYTSGGMQGPDGVKNAKSKQKGKAKNVAMPDEMVEYTSAFCDKASLQREKYALQREKLKQMQKQYQLDEMKAKFEMLQVLMAKSDPMPLDVKQIEKLCKELYSED